MAFKKRTKQTAIPNSPDRLLLELPRRKIPDVLPHQREIMRDYASKAIDKSDVALQLPTGSGKTLVGLLIAEWRRRKFDEKVVYLCPTRQLVNQATEQGEDKYGLSSLAFTGRIRDYNPTARAEYRNADKIAITTYNSLFNTNPFFDDADVVIVDDAHAAENYVASMWTLRVDRLNPDHKSLHSALAGVLKPYMSSTSYSRLVGDWNSPSDRGWVDKIPTPTLVELSVDLAAIFSAHAEAAGIRYEWSLLQDQIVHCQLYLSSQDILLRPLICPTWTHVPFTSPGQRIFMSATLGTGGDLERLTGRSGIFRLSVPEGWERQGVGRRFFIFPGMSLREPGVEKLRLRLMRRAGRSLVLVPNQPACTAISEQVDTMSGFAVFNAESIEKSKKPFVNSKKAVAAVANRYDGIDFPGNECRLLFVDGLPRATNSQEKFLMHRMGANVLFNERIQTRVLQAMGRCTRSLEDFSAVVVTGDELQDYLADIKRRRFFHPELQAEIEFGVDQSKNMKVKDFIENFDTFIENGEDWEEVNKEIVAARAAATQSPFPAIDELSDVVEDEIAFQKALWSGDYEEALASAESVLAGLAATELRGYRALWHYLAGSAAWLGDSAGVHTLQQKSLTHFTRAKKATTSIPWLVGLSRYAEADDGKSDSFDPNLLVQVERVEGELAALGVVHDSAYTAREKQIIEGLASSEKGPFEEAHRLIGSLMGFSADNVEKDGSPDPWWIGTKFCFVFEDHQGAESTSSLSTSKARQVASHPKWIAKHVKESKSLEVHSVLVTPVGKANSGAIPHLDTVRVWQLEEFRNWAKNALSVLREIRRTFSEPGDLVWRAMAASKFEENQMSEQSIAKFLTKTTAAEFFDNT